MDASLFCNILEQTLLPFILAEFSQPNTHRFMQNNVPKHTLRAAQRFCINNGINW